MKNRFHDNEFFCKTCYLSDAFWSGGNSWGIDSCPICGSQETIMYKNMKYKQRVRAAELFEEWWQETRLSSRKENFGEKECIKVYKISRKSLGNSVFCDGQQEALEEIKSHFEEEIDLGDSLTLEVYEMEKEEYENLPEFQGW